MRALITGASGFVAKHLARELSAAGWHVDGVSAGSHSGGVAAWLAEPAEFFASRSETDITQPSGVRAALDATMPDAIFSLAGISSVAAAEQDPAEAFRVNCLGMVVTLREIVAYRERTGKNPVCLVAGSAEQYGVHGLGPTPLPEETPLRPVTAYAASKCAQEVVALQMHRARGLSVICVRSFNHSGGGQAPNFLVPALVRRALDLRASGGSELEIGNTTVVRDYLHVEDVVRAYRLLVERGDSGEVYNVCSGMGLSVEAIARKVMARAGVKASLHTRADLVRPVDIPVLIGNNTKLSRTTGWHPARGFDDIVEDLILAAS